MEKQNNDYWQRIEKVLKHADMSANYFAKYIGLRHGENLYQIKRGRNKISLDVARRIHRKFPRFSISWLMCGEPEVIDNNRDTIEILPLYYDMWTIRFLEDAADEQLIISTSTANGAQFAVSYKGNPMETPFYLRDTIFLFRKQSIEIIPTGSGLYLIDYKGERLFRFLERKAYMDCIQMVGLVPENQDPEVVDYAAVESLWKVCATVKRW